jgi:hypothetical protein
MKKKRLEAIRILSEAMQRSQQYKKDWRDYIEIITTEVLEESGIESTKRIIKIRKRIAERVLGLFDADWWELQESNEH